MRGRANAIAMNTSPQPAHTETPFRGQTSWPQFRQVQSALLPWWARPYVTAAAMTYLMVSLGVGWSAALSSPAEAVWDLLFAGFTVIAIWAGTFYLHSRAWKAHNALHGDITGTVGEKGIEWSTAITSSSFPWEKILKFKQLPDMTLAFYSSRCALYFPRSFFSSEEDWRHFNDTVSRHVKSPA